MTTKKSTNHEIKVELDLAQIIMEKSGEYIPLGTKVCIAINQVSLGHPKAYIFNVEANKPHLTTLTWKQS